MPDLIDRVLMLSRLDVFAQLTSEQLALLGLVAEIETHAAGEVLYEESGSPAAMYLVVRGRVALERAGALIATVEAGQDFGTWALFDPEPRLTSARVVTTSTLLRIDRQAFDELVEDHPDLAHGLFRSLARRVRTLARMVEERDERTSREHWV